MFKKLVPFFSVVALIAVSFMCFAIGITALQTKAKITSVADNANRQINNASFSYNAKLQALSDRADLTWKNVDYLILNAGLTANVARQASIKELATLDTLNNGINAGVAGLNDTLATTNTTIGKFGRDSNTTLIMTNQAIAKLPSLIDTSTLTLQSINKQVSNPAIPITIDNVAKITTSGASISSDLADETHKLVHPDKKKLGFWGTLDGAAMWAHSHIVPPLF